MEKFGSPSGKRGRWGYGGGSVQGRGVSPALTFQEEWGCFCPLVAHSLEPTLVCGSGAVEVVPAVG